MAINRERIAIVPPAGVDSKFKDNTYLNIGSGADANDPSAYDVRAYWDGTNLLLAAYADDSLIEFGDSAVTQKSFDLKWYANEASGASYLYFDASANLIYSTGVDLQIKDDDFLVFGTGSGATGDLKMEWDTAAGTDHFQISATADDTLISFGVSAATQLSFDMQWFAEEANGASYLYFDSSANNVYTTGVDIQVKDADYLTFGTGSGATGDVQVSWDATDLDFTCAANNTVVKWGTGTNSFDMWWYGSAATNYLLWDASDNGLEVIGDARVDFSGATVAAANTDGGIIKAGTSGSPVTEDTADMKFVSLYFDDGATSGDARGIYNRLAITGAGGGGESLRSLTSVTDVAAATAHGAHLSLAFGTSGSVTGQGVATRSTLHMPATALAASNVTYAALQAEVYSDAATSDPAGNLLSFVRLVNGGDTTGAADVDDDAAALEFIGFTGDTGNMIGANTAGAGTLTFTNWTTLRIRIAGTNYYIPIAQTIAATG